MTTVSVKKIISKFVQGESILHHQKQESIPIQYYASLSEAKTLEDLVVAVNSYYDFKDECQVFRYILSVLDFNDEEITIDQQS